MAHTSIPVNPAPGRTADPERDLVAAFRRLAPPERAKALRLVLELETAAQRAAARFLLH